MDSTALTAKLTAIASGVSAVGSQLTKSHDEIVAKLGQLSQTGTTPEQDSIIDSITSSLTAAQATAQSLDDLVPDAPVDSPPSTPIDSPAQ